MQSVEFNVLATYTPDFEFADINVNCSVLPIPFPILMLATEHMMRLTALMSGLSFEEAMELLVVGAKNINQQRPSSDLVV